MMDLFAILTLMFAIASTPSGVWVFNHAQRPVLGWRQPIVAAPQGIAAWLRPLEWWQEDPPAEPPVSSSINSPRYATVQDCNEARDNLVHRFVTKYGKKAPPQARYEGFDRDKPAGLVAGMCLYQPL